MAAAVASTVASVVTVPFHVLGGCCDAVQTLKRQLSTLKQNNHEAESLLRQVEKIEGVLKTDLPLETLNDLRNRLGTCERYCKEALERRSKVGRFIDAEQLREILRQLRAELGAAVNAVNLAVSVATLRLVRDDRPAIGSYFGPSYYPVLEPGVSPPQAPPPPEVEIQGKRLVVKWALVEDAVSYMVEYDEQRGLQCAVTEPGVTQIVLAPPQIEVRRGKEYSVRVLAVNTGGPGEWSQSSIAYFHRLPPEPPTHLEVDVTSPTSTEISFEMPHSHLNDSPATKCIIERAIAGEDHTWCSTEKELCSAPEPVSRVTVTLDDLEPNKTYLLRVRLRNDVDSSRPTDAVELRTFDLIPGPPEELQRECKHNEIRLSWDPPTRNSHEIDHYRIMMRTMHGSEQMVAETKETSAVVTELRIDTRYEFKVCAVTHSGREGKFCEEIPAKTKRHPAFRGMTASLALVGGVALGVVPSHAMAPVLHFVKDKEKKQDLELLHKCANENPCSFGWKYAVKTYDPDRRYSGSWMNPVRLPSDQAKHH